MVHHYKFKVRPSNIFPPGRIPSLFQTSQSKSYFSHCVCPPSQDSAICTRGCLVDCWWLAYYVCLQYRGVFERKKEYKSFGTQFTQVFGRGYCQHMVHLRIQTWNLPGKFYSCCLCSDITDPPPPPPFTTSISYTTVRALNLCVGFIVLGVYSMSHFPEQFVLAGDRLSSLRSLFSCSLGSKLVDLSRRFCLEVFLLTAVSNRSPWQHELVLTNPVHLLYTPPLWVFNLSLFPLLC